MSDRPGTILLIHYKFPPVPAVSGRRLGYLARHWRAAGWRVLLVTADWSASYPQVAADEAIIPDADRYVVPRRDLRSFLLSNSAGVTLPSRVKAPSAKWRSRLMPPLLRLVRSFPFSYFLGDGGPLYVRAAVQCALPLIEREGVTYTYAYEDGEGALLYGLPGFPGQSHFDAKGRPHKMWPVHDPLRVADPLR